MLTILEIALTVAAWRRGWRMWALAPLAVALLTAVFAGMAIGASGGSPQAAMPVFIMLDLACVGVLSCLVARPRRRPEPEANPGIDTWQLDYSRVRPRSSLENLASASGKPGAVQRIPRKAA